MLDLSVVPEAILTAKDQEEFLLDGVRVVFEQTGGGAYFFLYTSENEDAYAVWSHVRNKQHNALFTRQELFDLVQSKQYIIS